MTHAAVPDQLENRLVRAFPQCGLLHSAADGPGGRLFVQISTTQHARRLADVNGAHGFVLGALEIVHDAQEG